MKDIFYALKNLKEKPDNILQDASYSRIKDDDYRELREDLREMRKNNRDLNDKVNELKDNIREYKFIKKQLEA